MANLGIRLGAWSVFAFAGVVGLACSSPHREFTKPGDGGSGGAGSQTAGSSGRAAGSSGKSGASSEGGGGSSGQSGSSSSNGAGGSGGGADPGDPCESNPCTHGTCEANGSSYACSCDTGYRGDNCEIDIDDCKDDPCTHGTCVDGVATFQCDCGDTGYAGNLCQTAIKNCAQTPCLNRGACTDVGASRTCNCAGTGTTGTSCEVDINECSTNNGGCDPLTTCTNSTGGFSCGPCPSGYKGSGLAGCTDINECSTNNGGCDPLTTCTNSTGGFSCGPCPSGYKGSGLAGCTDINECSTNNGGCDSLTTCTNTGGSRTCGPCPNGYSGTGVSGCTNIDDCAGSPCKNGGTCVDGINAANCTCKGSWSGSTCQNATLTINASARGYYADADWFPPSTGNTLTGWGGGWMYSSFFVFPIPSFTGNVSAVTLRLEHEGYFSLDASEIVTVREVSTPVATLLSNTMPSQAIYQDLATGTQYGSLNGWSEATVGTIRSFAMSGAITPVSAARGANFAIGVSTSPVKVADTSESIRFSLDVEARTHQLQVVVVPP